MRHTRNFAWPAAAVLAIILNFSLIPATAASLSGTRTIGPSGDYASITAAIADVKAQTLGGALILELQTNYVSTVETFPLVLGNLTTTAANTLTLRPQLGATNLIITCATSGATTVDLSGAQYVTIDGRPGGVGSNSISGGGAASQLTIASTSVSGRALRFINGASQNTICYTTFRGVSTSPNNGVVFFSNSTGATGNNNNTMEHCDIGDGVTSPVNCLYGAGSSTPKDNSGNTIDNCNIFNFYASSGDQYGILLLGGNTGWTITSNSFYLSVTRTGPGHIVGAIYINSPAGNNFVVSGNAIGGWAPNASGLWIYGTYTGNIFIGINLNVGSVTPSSVQGNLIQSFNWQTTQNLSTAPGVWGGITVSGGSVNVGTETGNTIGGSGGVAVTTSGSGALTTGISSTSTNTVVIANNTLSFISVYGSNSLFSASLTGIQVTAGTNIICNNLVGIPSSLQAATAPSGVNGQAVMGISSSSSNSATITGNTVANLINSYTNIFGGQVRGIITYDGVNIISGNTVRNLTTSCGDANGDTLAAVLGIGETSSQAGQTVSQNNVNTLACTSAKEAVFVTGIFYAGPASGTNLITRNLVHTLTITSTNMSSTVEGMIFRGGSFTAQNNMVRVGLRTGGGGTAGSSQVYGIYDLGQDAGRNFYHNSVYVGGSQSILTPRYTAAFISSGSGNLRSFQNNLFVNARSKTGSTGKPYAVIYTSPDLTGLTADGNLYLASGTSGVLGRNTNTDCTTLAAWQAATAQDATSLAVDPLFISTSDLHISSNSPAINAGLFIGLTDDFDGDRRSTGTPTIGADEYIADYSLVPGYDQLSGQTTFGVGANLLAFQGIPSLNYALEMATNLVSPVLWQPLVTNSATANGSLFFTNVASQPQVFYRTRSVP